MTRTVRATESFTYSNGELATVSSGRWANLHPGNGSGSVVSNTYHVGYGNPVEYRELNATYADDQYAKCTLTWGSTPDGDMGGVILRASADTDAGIDCYRVRLYRNYGAGQFQLLIERINNGTISTLVTNTSLSGSWASGDTVEGEVGGSGTSTVIRSYRNGTLADTYTDNGGSALNTGRPGHVMNYGFVDVLRMDDWEAGDVTAASSGSKLLSQLANQGGF